MSPFKALFSPRSIALVGASADSSKIGYRLADNIISRRFPGAFYLVNPKGGTILGHDVLTSIDDLPEGIDLVILSLPKAALIPAVQACVQRRSKCLVALTAGFKETGAEGLEQEQQLKSLLERTKTRLVGPNCAGLANTWADLQASIEIYPPRGSVSLISQSGSLCSAFSSNLSARQIGISKYISLGNKVNVNEADLIDHLGSDETTNCIALYLEDISNGPQLREAAARVSLIKPIVALKAGRTSAGARATFSHTGALAGVDRVADGAFRQMGIIRVNSLTELYDLSAALALMNPLVSGEIAILSDAGGPGVIATDAAVTSGLTVPQLSAEVQERLHRFLPAFASVRNPVDMTFTRDVSLYTRCVAELRKAGFQTALVTIPSHFAVKDEMVEALMAAAKEIPLVVSWLAADEVEIQKRELWRAGIPVFSDPATAAGVLGYMHRYGRWLQNRSE